jgi:nucleotide-binding universal stress UspA family protein
MSREDESALARPASPATRLANIVVALDGSDSSRDAVAFAVRIAAISGSRLHLVHAIDRLSCGPPSSVLDETRISELFAFAEHRLHEERSGHPAGPASSIECVRLGHAATQVVAVAADRKADLIVAGTRDRPGRHRLSEESTAGDIVRRSQVPVLVVHEGTQPPPRGTWLFRNPLVAVDYSLASAAALKSATLLARGLRVDVVRAIAEEPAPNTGLTARYARSRAIMSERSRLEQWIRATLGELRAPSRAAVAVGPPDAALVDFAVGGGYDLVACGTHGRRKRPAGQIGSVAESLLDAVTCPVLILREASEPLDACDPIPSAAQTRGL